MAETKLQIYGDKRNEAFTREIKTLNNSNIQPKNKELIISFQDYLFSKGAGNLRVAKVSAQLRIMCRWTKELNMNQNFDQYEKKDLVTLISFINRLSEKSEATKADYRRAVKQFFRWFKDEDQRVDCNNEQQRFIAKKLYNYIEKEISACYKVDQIDPKTVISEDEILLILEKGCNTPKEKAFISLLHETGMRAAEFLNLTVGSLIQKDNYLEIHVPDGKTGKRIIYATKSIPYVLRYLDIHPFKNSANSFLWVSSANKNRNDPLRHIGGQKLIDRCFKRAKIIKKHNWHWFRHSRATILAPKLNEVMLCKYMGWVLGSNQVKIYVHLCHEALEDVFLTMNSIKPREEEIDKPIKCMCGSLNGTSERYCFKCHRPLSTEVVLQDKEIVNSEINKTVQFMMEMTKNPEMMKQFQKFKNQ